MSNLSEELLVSFGEIKNGIKGLGEKLEVQEKRLLKTEEILYKLASNEQTLLSLTEESKDNKKKINKLENTIDELKKEVDSNKTVVRNIKWFFGIASTIAVGVITFGLKEIFFGGK